MKKCGIIENVNNNKYKLYPSLLKRKKEQKQKNTYKNKKHCFFSRIKCIITVYYKIIRYIRELRKM